MEKSQQTYKEFVEETRKLLDKKLENGEIDLVQYEDCIVCLTQGNIGNGSAESAFARSHDSELPDYSM